MNKIYRRLVKYSIVCFIFIMLVFTLQIDMIVNISNNSINKIGYDEARYISDGLINNLSNALELRMMQVRSITRAIPKNTQSLNMKLASSFRLCDFSSVGLYKIDGTIDIIYGNDIIPVDKTWFLNSINRNEERIFLGRNEMKELTLLFSLPAKYGEYNGIVSALPIQYINDIIQSSTNDDWYYYLIDSDGNDIINGNKFYLFDSVDMTNNYELSVLDRMKSGSTFYDNIVINGNSINVSYQRVPYTKWYIAIVLNYARLTGSISEMSSSQTSILVFGFIIILACVSVIYFVFMCELKGQLVRITKSDKAKSTFLANMSHDIRTPMNGIVGMTEIASSNLDDKPKVSTCLGMIKSSGMYMIGLIDNVLNATKVESGELLINNEEVCLSKVVNTVLCTMSSRMEMEDITIDVIVHDIKASKVMSDELKLCTLLLCLLDNAVKFNNHGGKVWFEVYQEHDNLHFLVRDNGYGINSKDMQNLFSLFQRGDSMRTTSKNGAGIGLALVKAIVDKMHGIVDVESKIGIGSQFHVILPVQMIVDDYSGLSDYRVLSSDFRINNVLKQMNIYDEYNPNVIISNEQWLCSKYSSANVISIGKDSNRLYVTEPVFASDIAEVLCKMQISSSKTLDGRVVLVAEDNELNFEIINELLAEYGLIVEHAEDGLECVNMFNHSEKYYYFAILMDIRMPNMDGYEATMSIRELDRADAKSIPIIATTADVYVEAIQKCKEVGMNAHVGKPVDIDEVIKLLEEVL